MEDPKIPGQNHLLGESDKGTGKHLNVMKQYTMGCLCLNGSSTFQYLTSSCKSVQKHQLSTKAR